MAVETFARQVDQDVTVVKQVAIGAEVLLQYSQLQYIEGCIITYALT